MPKFLSNLTPNRLAVLICIYFVAQGIRYSAHTPLFEGPDELAHFVYAHQLLVDRALPVIPSREELFQTRHYEIHQMPLFYIAGIPFIAPFSRDDIENYYELNPFASIGTVTGNNENIILHPLEHSGDTVYAVWAMRLMSLSFAVVTLLAVYRAGTVIWDERIGLGAMLLLASIPMFIHVSASINNDNLNNTFCALTVLLSLKTWQEKTISRYNGIALAVLLSLVAVTKLTGLSAFLFVIGAHLVGGFARRYTWQQVWQLFGTIAVAFAILSSWYYIRNWILYQDLIAYAPTRAVWARGGVVIPSGFELWGVWESFWMSLGHLNVPGPAWLSPYTTTISALGLLGVAVMFYRQPEFRWRIAYLFIVTVIVWAGMIYITRRVNVSQGRALYPGIAATAPMIVMGWRTLLGKRLFILPIVPLAVLSMVVPFTALDTHFEKLEPVNEAAPRNRLDATAETITVYGYTLLTDQVTPDDDIVLDVYFSGTNEENPVLFVTAQNPLNGEKLGTLNEYPGMVATDSLNPDQAYRARMHVPLTELELLEDDRPYRPFQVELALGWRVPDEDDAGEGRYLDWFNQNGDQIGGVFFPGPVLMDTDYVAPQLEHTLDVNFGNLIGLQGYTIEEHVNGFTVDLLWNRLAPIDRELTFTLVALGEDGEVLGQNDAPPPGYPTTAWADTPPFVIRHMLPSAPELELHDVASIRLGWYDAETLERLPTSGSGDIRDNLLWLMPGD